MTGELFFSKFSALKQRWRETEETCGRLLWRWPIRRQSVLIQVTTGRKRRRDAVSSFVISSNFQHSHSSIWQLTSPSARLCHLWPQFGCDLQSSFSSYMGGSESRLTYGAALGLGRGGSCWLALLDGDPGSSVGCEPSPSRKGFQAGTDSSTDVQYRVSRARRVGWATSILLRWSSILCKSCSSPAFLRRAASDNFNCWFRWTFVCSLWLCICSSSWDLLCKMSSCFSVSSISPGQ